MSSIRNISVFSLILPLLIFASFSSWTILPVSSEKVLVLCPISSKSHKNVFEPLVSELAKRGHQVTIISGFKPSTERKNVREIAPLQPYDFMRDYNVFEVRKAGILGMMAQGWEPVFEACHDIFKNKDVQDVIQNEKFDLILIDALLNNCLNGIIHKSGAPWISVVTFPAPNLFTSRVGNRLPLSFVPNPMIPLTSNMTFWERIVNLCVDTLLDFMFSRQYRDFEKIYREHLGQDLPGIEEIESNTSLIMMNSHFSLTFPRPTLPDVIEIGGIHCRPGRPLPKDIEEFVSGAKDGFIFFSLGSIVKPQDMPEATRKVFVNVFSRLKQRVLWKWNDETMPDVPKNVKLSKWLPQQDILAHPNIKIFMTHGGLLSLQESIYHGTPMIGLPVFADQDLNMNKAQTLGMAIALEILDLTEDALEKAIQTILNDNTFRENIKKTSVVFRDEIDTPKERAVFWAEYVMRHKGATHLRSAARNLNFFQYHSLDVIGLILLVVLSTLTLLIILATKLIRKIFGKTQSQREGINKKKQ